MRRKQAGAQSGTSWAERMMLLRTQATTAHRACARRHAHRHACVVAHCPVFHKHAPSGEAGARCVRGQARRGRVKQPTTDTAQQKQQRGNGVALSLLHHAQSRLKGADRRIFRTTTVGMQSMHVRWPSAYSSSRTLAFSTMSTPSRACPGFNASNSSSCRFLPPLPLLTSDAERSCRDALALVSLSSLWPTDLRMAGRTVYDLAEGR
jgi:hypothetical protein